MAPQRGGSVLPPEGTACRGDAAWWGYAPHFGAQPQAADEFSPAKQSATQPGCSKKENMTMSKIYYLAYGSNLNLEQMANRCPTAKMAGAATLENYQLLFRGGHANAVATIEPQKGGSVPVMLWDITPADEVALDRYEGWPFLYRKEKVCVTLNKKRVTAMVYIMNEGRPLGTPSCYYYNIILQGYQSARFDVDILKQAVRNSKA